MMVAVIAALVFTVLIGVFWVMSLSTGTTQDETSTAPSPLSALLANIRGTLDASGTNTHPTSQGNVVQVIDAGTQYDESNPAPVPPLSSDATVTE